MGEKETGQKTQTHKETGQNVLIIGQKVLLNYFTVYFFYFKHSHSNTLLTLPAGVKCVW